MDLGLEGRTALVCASSRGLGRACAYSLAREGVHVILNGRTEATLLDAAQEIQALTGRTVHTVVADVRSEAGRQALYEACPNPDILINNAGGPPPGDFREWAHDAWIAALEQNMLAPIFMIKHVIDGMLEREFGRIVNITSAAVKAPIPTLGLSNGARSGLTGFVAGLARQVVHKNVTINNLLPGPFETERLRANIDYVAKQQSASFEKIYEERKQSNPAKRFGQAEEFGDACAYLCAAQSGFMTGQNIVLDGGHYPGTL